MAVVNRGFQGGLRALPAYLKAPGVVLRCAACNAALVWLVRGNGRAWLDLRGIRVLQVALPPPA